MATRTENNINTIIGWLKLAFEDSDYKFNLCYWDKNKKTKKCVTNVNDDDDFDDDYVVEYSIIRNFSKFLADMEVGESSFVRFDDMHKRESARQLAKYVEKKTNSKFDFKSKGLITKFTKI